MANSYALFMRGRLRREYTEDTEKHNRHGLQCANRLDGPEGTVGFSSSDVTRNFTPKISTSATIAKGGHHPPRDVSHRLA